VRQLQALNGIMKSQLEAYPVKTVMIFGVAGGNGLEHADPGKYERVYGVDINREYLRAAEERFAGLKGTLQCLCLDLTKDAGKLPQAELVIADLLIEYIGYETFAAAVKQAGARVVSCVIQINPEEEGNWVSDSPYLHAFDRLDEVHHEMTAEALAAAMKAEEYREILRESTDLPNGKKLMRMDFEKAEQ
jgi:hypothetical protein